MKRAPILVLAVAGLAAATAAMVYFATGDLDVRTGGHSGSPTVPPVPVSSPELSAPVEPHELAGDSARIHQWQRHPASLRPVDDRTGKEFAKWQRPLPAQAWAEIRLGAVEDKEQPTGTSKTAEVGFPSGSGNPLKNQPQAIVPGRAGSQGEMPAPVTKLGATSTLAREDRQNDTSRSAQEAAITLKIRPSPAAVTQKNHPATQVAPLPSAANSPSERTNPRRPLPAWPKPFTPEEERYRQQMGVQSYVDEQHELATGQKRP
jgi:hypothetical protein